MEPAADGALVRRDEILGHIEEDFPDQRFGDRLFTDATRAIGFKPMGTRTLAEEKQKGRVNLYDPVLEFLIMGVNWHHKGKLSSLNNALGPYRRLWGKLHKGWEADAVTGFSKDREYGAWLLMLTSPDYGLPVVELYRRVREKPALLSRSRFGPEYLENVFIAYKEAHMAAFERMTLKSSADDPSPDEQREQWARDWVHAAARYFAGNEQAGDA